MLPLLILDLDETLLHSSTEPPPGGSDFDDGAYFTRLRPHLREFLEAIDPHYQVAVFTAAGLYYALDMIKGIRRVTRYPLEVDPLFDYRHCEQASNALLKDLRHFEERGFDLRRALAVDDKPQGFARHPRHVLPAPAYYGEAGDTFLLELIPTLKRLATEPDIPAALHELQLENAQLLLGQLLE